MIVECENCKTKFRLDDSKVPDKGINVRCSKCKHAFFIKKPSIKLEEEQPRPEKRPEPPPAEKEEGKDVPYEATVKIDLSAQKDLTFEEEEEKVAEQKEVARPKRAMSLPFVIIIVLIGLIALAGAAAYFTGMLDQFFGPPETPISPLKISQLDGYFDEGLNSQKVFIIKGVVTNESKKPRRFIRVKGIIFDKKGKPVVQRLAYCGNLILPRDLKTKARQEIEKLMKKKDATKILRKGGRLPFMVALYNLPKDISEYSAEIVSAEIMK